MSQHHDPVHPDSGHLTPELLADLAEGLLDAASAQHAQQHLDQCSLCQGVAVSLRDVSSTLAALPTPSMPDDVETRILSALPAAASEEKTAATTVVPLAAERTRRRGWAGPSLGIAASVAGVLLVAGLIYPTLNGSDDAADMGATADSGPNAAAESQPELDQSRLAASRSGTNYQADKLSSQVDSLVAEREKALRVEDGTSVSATTSDEPVPSSSQNAPAAGSVDAADLARVPMATDPAAAQACLEEYLGASDVVPLAIDIGWFQGKVAAIIVLPSSVNPDKAEVWIVDPGCSGPDSVVLYFANVPLP